MAVELSDIISDYRAEMSKCCFSSFPFTIRILRLLTREQGEKAYPYILQSFLGSTLPSNFGYRIPSNRGNGWNMLATHRHRILEQHGVSTRQRADFDF